jgi:hypothetical protein
LGLFTSFNLSAYFSFQYCISSSWFISIFFLKYVSLYFN